MQRPTQGDATPKSLDERRQHQDASHTAALQGNAHCSANVPQLHTEPGTQSRSSSWAKGETTTPVAPAFSLQSNPRVPRTLAHTEDEENLNKLHCLVRSEITELFEVSPETKNVPFDEGHGKQMSKRHFPGRVGIRCVFCAHETDRQKKAQLSSYYPPSLEKIYRLTCTWQRVHFKVCPFVPDEMRRRYEDLKAKDRSRGRVKYWYVSARAIGLKDKGSGQGIYFST